MSTPVKRIRPPEPLVSDYWALPTVHCSCGFAFSLNVAREHRLRTGHAMRQEGSVKAA